jgi:hypothetical protein
MAVRPAHRAYPWCLPLVLELAFQEAVAIPHTGKLECSTLGKQRPYER